MSIDWWTLGIETVNVAVLVWLLGRFFWRPVSAMIAQRHAEATRLLDEAEARRAEAAAELDGIRKTREGFAAEHDAIVAKARDDAEKERAVLLEKARQDAQSLQAKANATVAADRAAARSEWAERSSQLAVDIARRLVSPLRGQNVQDEFADRLIAAIDELPDDTRSAARNGSNLEALSATPIPADRQEDIRRRIGKVLGGAPPISFRTDPSLIAGIELRGPHLVITNSWKADLERILGEVSHGD